MKKFACAALALITLLALILGGCAPAYDKSPAEYEGVRWVTPDYSFRFNPSDECRGNFTVNGTKYNIQVEFDGSSLSVIDTDKDKELFYGDWQYEDGDYLFVHTIVYNTEEYEELKNYYAEFFRLNQEKLE